jgi:hypothetical protein
MKSRAALIVAVVIGMFVSSSAFAQIGQGRLSGTVTDAQGAVMPGVTVTVTSPALIGAQTTVTEANGKFLFPSLPSGTYKLNFELSGFQKVNRENINVVTGQTISADVQLPLATLAESVTVTGASPVVDVTTTKVGTDLKGEALTAVPNSTDAWGALSEAPGVRMQGFDVGGSHKSQQSGYEVFGIQNQSRIVTDGVDHTEGVGGTGYYEDYYSNEEVSISALGSDVEMNSGGAAVVSTIKSGGNKFKGLENYTYENGAWVGDNNTDALRARGFTGNPNLQFYEAHLDLGGPIMRDKAWFFVAYNTFKIDKVVSGVPQSVATDLGLFHNYTGKGTYKPSAADTVIGYVQRGRKEKPKRSLSTLNPPESVLAQDSLTYTYKGEWQRVFSSRTFLDVTVGNYHSLWPMVPQVSPTTNPPIQIRSTGAVAGAGWNAFNSVRNNPQAKAQLTYYLPEKKGSHDFKFGFEFRHDYYQLGHNGNSGPIRYSIPSPGAAPDRIRFADVGANADFGTGWVTSPNLDQRYSGYVQDRWAPNNRLSITAGVRIDNQALSYGDGLRKPLISDVLPDGSRIFPATTTVAGQTLLKNTNAAPRLGFTYDLSGKGQTVLKGFYGRYYNNMADGFSSANPGGTNYVDYNFNDLNHNGRYDGPQELGALRTRIGGADAPVDPSAKTPYTEEFSGSVEHQFWGESSIRATYVRKHSADFIPFYYNPYVPAWDGKLTVPTRQVSSDGRVFNLVDVPNALASQSSALYTNIPDSDFYYDTIEVAFNKRFSSKFFIQTSADYQWRNELRSADIPDWGSTSPLSTDPIGVNYFVNPNPSVSNRQKTTTYHFQLLGRYTFPFEIGFAANYRYQSGFPYSEIIADGDTSPGLNVTPSPFFVQNLDQNRSDSVSLLNFRLDKGFTFGGHYKLTGIFDLYNVLNANPVTNFSLTNGNFGHVIAVLDPRVAQVAVRFEF